MNFEAPQFVPSENSTFRSCVLPRCVSGRSVGDERGLRRPLDRLAPGAGLKRRLSSAAAYRPEGAIRGDACIPWFALAHACDDDVVRPAASFASSLVVLLSISSYLRLYINNSHTRERPP